jgi:hypothetical protein
MPWEIDHALLMADKLKHSIYNINQEDTVYFDTALNLSSKSINWEKSSIPKQFFIEKYKVFSKLLGDKIQHAPFIYEGNDLYGHLDLQKTVVQNNIDYYMSICPDIDFSPSMLYYILEYAKSIKNEYFILTPQIFRCWDSSWDMLVNKNFLKYRYDQCVGINIHDIRHQLSNSQDSDVSVSSLNEFKFAGWCDLYNKNFYEKLVPVLNEWSGYGPWDFYSINICKQAKHFNVDVSQYLLKNEVIWFYDVGDIRYTSAGKEDVELLKDIYTNFISKNLNKKEQTFDIYSNINYYVNQWIKYAKENNIIK